MGLGITGRVHVVSTRSQTGQHTRAVASVSCSGQWWCGEDGKGTGRGDRWAQPQPGGGVMPVGGAMVSRRRMLRCHRRGDARVLPCPDHSAVATRKQRRWAWMRDSDIDTHFS